MLKAVRVITHPDDWFHGDRRVQKVLLREAKVGGVKQHRRLQNSS